MGSRGRQPYIYIYRCIHMWRCVGLIGIRGDFGLVAWGPILVCSCPYFLKTTLGIDMASLEGFGIWTGGYT